jgi:hypothetical protein
MAEKLRIKNLGANGFNKPKRNLSGQIGLQKYSGEERRKSWLWW